MTAPEAGRGRPKISTLHALELMQRWKNGEEAKDLAKEAGVSPSALSQRFSKISDSIEDNQSSQSSRKIINRLKSMDKKISNINSKIDLLLEKESK